MVLMFQVGVLVENALTAEIDLLSLPRNTILITKVIKRPPDRKTDLVFYERGKV